jgi:hypothetical protein
LGCGFFASLNDRLESKSPTIAGGNTRNNIRMSLTLPNKPVPYHLDTESMFFSRSSSQHPADDVTATFETINTYTTLGDIPRLSCRTANYAFHDHLHWLIAEL